MIASLIVVEEFQASSDSISGAGLSSYSVTNLAGWLPLS
jgi:hypothetical protein